jgi:hypothetical protein
MRRYLLLCGQSVREEWKRTSTPWQALLLPLSATVSNVGGARPEFMKPGRDARVL